MIKHYLFQHLLSIDIQPTLLQHLEQITKTAQIEYISKSLPKDQELKHSISYDKKDMGALFSLLKAVIKEMPEPVLRATIFYSFYNQLFPKEKTKEKLEEEKLIKQHLDQTTDNSISHN